MRYKIKKIKSRQMTVERIRVIVCIILFFACIMFNQHYEQKSKAPVSTGAFLFLCLCYIQAVMDGDIDGFINAYLKHISAEGEK